MRRSLIIIVVIIAFFAILGGVAGFVRYAACNRLVGCGQIVTRTVELPAFHKIDVSCGVDVRLIKDSTSITRIEADSNIIDKVVLRVENGELIVGFDVFSRSINNCTVRVIVPSDGRISDIEATSAAHIWGDVVLTGEKLELDASSAAHIDIKANVVEFDADASSAATIEAIMTAERCQAKASSAAKILFTGQARSCEVDVNSAAKFKSPNFVVENYVVASSSGASASVNCATELKASASSGSSISYTGQCHANTTESSGGSVRQCN